MQEPGQFDFFSEEETSTPVAEGKTAGEESAHRPLAARMRPRTLAEIIGQEHLLRDEALLPRLIRTNRFGSLLFYGPPGSGKTTLAEVIARETGARFVRVNAVQSNVAELRRILEVARRRPESDTVLFIDELHRFNKAQQDLLLPDVEEGSVRLIGATTHNPGFYVNPPLLSRSHLFRLEPLGSEEVVTILRRALGDAERGLGARGCRADEAVLSGLAGLCDGDLRRALNALEVLVMSLPEESELEVAHIETFARERRIRYDADEDEHYDTISAYIKSMRGGDPDAALYWLAKMLAGGEDPRFIARRLVILASEDVGMADSRALPLATATHRACDFVGRPECEINLAHATVYLATAPKSNRAYEGLMAAKKAIREQPLQAVPVHLRDTGGEASKRLGHGKGYRYSHDYPEAVSGQDFLEKPLDFYRPGENGEEKTVAERLERWKRLKSESRPGKPDRQE